MPDSATELLLRLSHGDSAAFDQLFDLIYDDIKRVAHGQLAGNFLANELSSTEVVHEAYLRLIDSKHHNWRSRSHFMALAARVVRQILVDRARHQLALKRGGGVKQQALDEEQLSRGDDGDVLRVHEAIERLAEIDELQARIVELRFFGGLTVQEVADLLGKPKRWVEGEWTMIRAWLRAELEEGPLDA